MKNEIFVLKIGTYKSQLSQLKNYNENFYIKSFEEINTVGFENGYIRNILAFINCIKDLINSFEKNNGVQINKKIFVIIDADYVKVKTVESKKNEDQNIETIKIFNQEVISFITKKYQHMISEIYIDPVNQVALINLIQSINNAGLKIEKLIPIDYFQESVKKFKRNAYVHISDYGIRLKVIKNNVLTLKKFIRYDFHYLSRNLLVDKLDIKKAIYHEVNMSSKIEEAFFDDIESTAFICRDVLRNVNVDNLFLTGTVLNEKRCLTIFKSIFKDISVNNIYETPDHYDYQKCINKNIKIQKAPYLIGLVKFLFNNNWIKRENYIINKIKMIAFSFFKLQKK